MTEQLKVLVERLKAVSHPLRLRVLALLDAGELCVCQVAETLGVPTSSISEALRELRRAGFVTERKEGRWVFVSLPEPPSALLASLLLEAAALPGTALDRARSAEIKGLSVQEVCGRHRPGAGPGEAADV
jgi:ArsR family transcriptional regulator, arsenate/arsenite/antimonite-responsive transcriptional repressor